MAFGVLLELPVVMYCLCCYLGCGGVLLVVVVGFRVGVDFALWWISRCGGFHVVVDFTLWWYLAY